MQWSIFFDEGLEGEVVLMYGWHFEVDIFLLDFPALGDVIF
jgi:hypothetical protein